MAKRISLNNAASSALEVPSGALPAPARPHIGLNIEPPDPPKFLSKPEAKEWVRLCQALAEMHILDLVDEKLLVLWCRTVAAIDLTHDELVTARDFVSQNAAGSTVQSAHMRNFLMLSDKLVKLAGELGLSPQGNAGLRLDRFRRPHEMSRSEKRGRDLIA